jgi:tetratricopeptide (TPR) repeat protein
MTFDAVDPAVSAQASLALGDSYCVDENYEDALDAYAIALSMCHDGSSSSSSSNSSGDMHNDATQFRALSHKAAALLRLDRYEEAVWDGQQALSGSLVGLREGETEACHHRVGVALFRLERYQDARVAFEHALQLALLNHNKRDTKQKHEDYIQRCKDLQLHQDVHMVELEEDSDMIVVEEIDQKPPARPAASGLKPAPRASGAPTPIPVVAASTTTLTNKPTMPKYQYYQNDKFMTIAILESNVKEESIRVTFATKRLTVILHKQGVDFTVICGKLFDKVNTEKCKVVIKEERVLVKLRKVDPHDWHELFSKALYEDDDGKDDQDDAITSKKPVPMAEDVIPKVQPTTVPRPYASHRDWDAIERNLKEQEKQEKPEGEEAMNALFQQIYAKADPETRRAMVKSYQTSGGTVLSTNWAEVKEKDYEKEREAPKGMEWKTWEGEKLEKE